MPAYQYLVADLLTGRLLADLTTELSGVRYNIVVNDSATASATLLPGSGSGGVARLLGSARCALYIQRGGQLPYSGPVWGQRYDRQAQSILLDSQDYLSYLDHLYITDNLGYAAVDQLTIARSLINYGMSKSGANLTPAVIGSTVSGVPRDRTYLGADQASVGQRLRELSAVDQGFDFRWYARYEGAYLRRVCQLGYPTLGRTYPTSGIEFDADADGVNLLWEEDGKGSANIVYGTGGTSATVSVPPTYTADNPGSRVAGYPRLEVTQAFSDITQSATLQAHVKGTLGKVKFPPQVVTLTVSSGATSEPDIGEYLPGDQCRVRVGMGDLKWPLGALIIGTIVSVDVAVDENFNDLVSVVISVSSVTEGS